MPLVKINYNDECFESLVKLYRCRVNSTENPDEFDVAKLYSVTENDEIIYGEYTFVRQDIDEESDSKKEDEKKMLPEGASWFKNFRNRSKTTSTGITEWEALISKVRTSFHQKNTWLKYEAGTGKFDKKSDEERIKNAIKALWGEDSPNEETIEYLEKPSARDAYTTIYGASVRLDIFAGREAVGGATTIVGRLYFLIEDNQVKPLSFETARKITENIAKPSEDDDSDNKKSQDSSSPQIQSTYLLSSLRNGIIDCFKNGLNKYLYIRKPAENENQLSDDNRKITSLIEKSGIRVTEFTCKSIEILYMFQVKTANRVYKVKCKGQDILTAIVDTNEELSLRCLSCNDQSLILNRNTVRIEKKGRSTNNEKAYEDYYVKLDGDKTLGLGDNYDLVINKIREHNIPIECKDCYKLRCKNNIVEGSELGADPDRKYCRDCTNCEVVYYVDGKPRYTPSLVYDFQARDLVLSTDGETCKVCGRTYYSTSLTDGVCKFCQGSEDEDQIQKAKRLYKIYSRALAPFTRLKHLFSSKSCFEDEEVIVFKLENEYYVIDKLQSQGNNKKFLSTASFRHKVQVKGDEGQNN